MLCRKTRAATKPVSSTKCVMESGNVNQKELMERGLHFGRRSWAKPGVARAPKPKDAQGAQPLGRAGHTGPSPLRAVPEPRLLLFVLKARVAPQWKRLWEHPIVVVQCKSWGNLRSTQGRQCLLLCVAPTCSWAAESSRPWKRARRGLGAALGGEACISSLLLIGSKLRFSSL